MASLVGNKERGRTAERTGYDSSQQLQAAVLDAAQFVSLLRRQITELGISTDRWLV